MILRTFIAVLLLFPPCSGLAQESARIYRSTDRGHSWSPSAAGFPADATVNDFAAAQEIVYAGTEAHGMFVSRDGGRTWTSSNEGLARDEKIDAVEVLGPFVIAGTTRNGIFVSRDSGRTWSSSSVGLTNTKVRALTVDSHRLFAGTNDGIFASDDAGRTWSQLTKGAQINGFTILGRWIFAAGTNGIARSDDHGRTWREVGTLGPVHNVSNDGESVYANDYDRIVLRTSDGGATWTRADKGLPSLYTFQILDVDGVLLAGQWPGVFLSTNRGAQWSQVRNGLPPNVPIKDLVRVGKDTILAGAGQKRGAPASSRPLRRLPGGTSRAKHAGKMPPT